MRYTRFSKILGGNLDHPEIILTPKDMASKVRPTPQDSARIVETSDTSRKTVGLTSSANVVIGKDIRSDSAGRANVTIVTGITKDHVESTRHSKISRVRCVGPADRHPESTSGSGRRFWGETVKPLSPLDGDPERAGLKKTPELCVLAYVGPELRRQVNHQCMTISPREDPTPVGDDPDLLDD